MLVARQRAVGVGRVDLRPSAWMRVTAESLVAVLAVSRREEWTIRNLAPAVLSWAFSSECVLAALTGETVAAQPRMAYV